jgi:hypothetical protein
MAIPERMDPQSAWDWYHRQPWLVGCNFIPSTAINQIEMWRAETFDPATIRHELDLAAGLGFNTLRVFLHDQAYAADPNGFKQRLDRFLSMCHARCIRPLLVLFDDCWNTSPKFGPQPAPVPGVHNSGWVQSPGSDRVKSPAAWPRLEAYLKDILTTFRSDPRVLAWDLYNEPGNNQLGSATLPLLREVFHWTRAVHPTQPVTVGIWADLPELNALSLQASDIISFHDYKDVSVLEIKIEQLKTLNRPILCTEYMARTQSSLFSTHLPVFKREHIGCYNWGLVSGKTQTIFSWNSKPGTPEPRIWFHDIFRSDGTPFDPQEIRVIQELVPPARTYLIS